MDDFQFLRVEFTDEDGGMLRSKEVLKDTLQLTFTSGVRLGNRTFQVSTGSARTSSLASSPRRTTRR